MAARRSLCGCRSWIVALAMVAVATAAAATDCVDYAQGMHWVGAPESFVDGRDIRVRDGYAFVASGGQGVTFLDLSAPGRPAILGTIDTPGYTLALDLGGDVLCVVDAYSGFRTIGVTDPRHPQSLGSVEIPGSAVDVAVRGDHAYICNQNGSPAGIHIVDISLPMDPSPAGFFAPPLGCLEMAFVGDLLLCVGNSALTVADVSDPLAPTVVGSIAMGSAVIGLVVDGSTVYCARGSDGLWIVDFAEPSAPVTLGRIPIPGAYAVGVAVRDGIAFVGDSHGSLVAIAVADLDAPEIIGQIATNSGLRAAAFVDNLLYVAGGEFGGVYVVDVSSQDTQSFAGQMDFPGYFGNSVLVRGDLAYIAAHGQVAIADISTPEIPVLVGSVATGREMTALELQDGILYCGGGGLQVVDATDPAAPVPGTYLDYPSTVDDLLAVADRLYLASRASGLLVYDITDRRQPTLIDDVHFGSSPVGLAEQDGLIYVAGRGGSLSILETGDGATLPELLGQVHTAGFGSDVAVDADFAYVTDELRGLYTIDVSTPEAPTIVSVIEPPGRAVRVVSSAGVAYLACESGGLAVIDVSEPDFPSSLGVIQAGVEVRGVSLGEDCVAIVTYHSGLLTAPRQCVDTIPPVSVPRTSPTSLREVYPNPFNPAITVRFHCRAAQSIEVAVYDLKGCRLATLADGEFGTGDHTVHWRGNDAAGRPLATGIYLVRLRSADGVESRKITLTR